MKHPALAALLSLSSLAAQGNLPLELGGSCPTSAFAVGPQMHFTEGLGRFPRAGVQNPAVVFGCVPYTTVFVGFGVDTSLRGWSLPLDLDLHFGTVGGCILYCSFDITLTVTADGRGNAVYSFPIPPAAAGFQFHTQAVVMDDQSLPGFVTSNDFVIVL